jgi:acyl dehydratase
VRTFSAPADLAAAVGDQLGSSSWHSITQDKVNRFADETGDHQWIHTDPARAVAGPFGAPVAHGYLMLSMVPALMGEVFQVDGAQLALNKELRRLRFLAPVPVGSRVRATIELTAARARPWGFWEADFSVTAEIDTDEKPAFIAEQVFLYQQR